MKFHKISEFPTIVKKDSLKSLLELIKPQMHELVPVVIGSSVSYHLGSDAEGNAIAIYEEDEDLYVNRNNLKHQNQNQNQNQNQKGSIKGFQPPKRMYLEEDVSGSVNNGGFVPFMRTNEFLDPAHAASPVPPSRESSAVKRDREKARQVKIY